MTTKVVPTILRIDRSTPFNPAEFIREGWSIWKGPLYAGGSYGFCGDEEQRSLALTEVDLSKIQLVTTFFYGQNCIRGKDKLRRLKESGHIRLDAKVFQTLWENKEKIPESWKEKTDGNITCVFFDGTILRDPNDCCEVLGLYWDGGEWRRRLRWLGDDWYSRYPSAVLVS